MKGTARRLSAASVAVVALSAVTFALAVMSHRVTLVSTFGTSMNPTYYQGDLVVVHRESRYQPGEIVAYRRPDKHLIVLHRIVGGDLHGFTFKGDNNQSIDPTSPPQSELIGRAVLHIPGGGLWFHRATSPELLACLVVVVGGSTAHTRHPRRRRHMSKHSTLPARLGWRTPASRAAASVSALLAISGLALAAAGWTRPATITIHEDVANNTATFSYHAQVPSSAAYDGTVVRSPDPVFRRLAQTVAVHLAYAGVPGSADIRVELSTASGWHTTIPVSRRVAFTGYTYDADVILDLRALEARARAGALATGMPAERLDVRVVPRITPLRGTVFSPQLGLSLTPLRLTLSDGSPLTVKGSSEPPRAVLKARQLRAAGAAVPVTTVRSLSWLLLALAAVSGFARLVLVAVNKPATEPARIQQRYAPLLLAVQPMPATAGRPIVDVTEFTALVTLAERYGLLILHWARSDVDTYVVQDDNTTYRYRPSSGEASPQPPEQPTPVKPGPVETPHALGRSAESRPPA